MDGQPAPAARRTASQLITNLYAVSTGPLSGASYGDIEEAKEAAIMLLIDAGRDESEDDTWGDDMGDSAQSLLTVVMLRVPALARRVLGIDE